ncbi:MAG: MBL fold metallo-hydrolase [Candidatus Pacebacteria bacterium]|nr:MBL fold metallo-hydrolase [Candidatus Paceibacterota bacterium]
MIISYLGKSCVRLQTGDTVIALNPPAKTSPFKVSGFGADLVFISVNHPDYAGVETVTYGEKKPFVIDGPGEYEVGGMMIDGYRTRALSGKDEVINTAYFFEFDSMKICYLGPIVSPEIPQEMKQGVDNVDVLFVPIGGKTVISSSEAYKLGKQFGAKLIIPIEYGKDQESGALESFLKEAGSKNSAPVDKLTIKLKDILNKECEIAIISAS